MSINHHEEDPLIQLAEETITLHQELLLLRMEVTGTMVMVNLWLLYLLAVLLDAVAMNFMKTAEETEEEIMVGLEDRHHPQEELVNVLPLNPSSSTF